MTILLIIFHVLVSIALVLIVLLQTGKGSDLASAFGGGGQNAVFGGAGPASFLNKMTTAVAVLFMATSFTLAYVSSSADTIMEDQPVAAEEIVESEAAPADEAAPAGDTEAGGETGTDIAPADNAPAADAAPADNAPAADSAPDTSGNADAAPAEPDSGEE